ncbi:hypothetical protein K440DRAFT_572351 [Wilcoxina mikolae CBS 423.85]|nr:hypothetical protein K440DRAFT_572351 [Wilcoxina mikolae CBS 423.85]
MSASDLPATHSPTRVQVPEVLCFNLGQPVTPQQHSRRIVSLKSVLNFNLSPEAAPHHVQEADQILIALLDAYAADPSRHRQPLGPPGGDTTDFYRADKLIQYFREFAPSWDGKANITRQVLSYLFPDPEPYSPASERDRSTQTQTRPLSEILLCARRECSPPAQSFTAIEQFAAALLECFFVPFLAQGGQTSVPPSLLTPSFLTSRSQVPNDHANPEIDRRPELRVECLTRDSACCVISGIYDHREHKKKRRSGLTVGPVQAAHIIPHALNGSTDGVIKDQYGYVWQILEIFDPGVRYTLEGELIDYPHNALLLHTELHEYFGQLLWWFEEVLGEENTYIPRIARRFPPSIMRPFLVEPNKRVVFVSRGGINVPDPRLLRLHAACAKILDMSGAAEYVERLHYDAEELRQRHVLKADGTSNLYALLCATGLVMVR